MTLTFDGCDDDVDEVDDFCPTPGRSPAKRPMTTKSNTVANAAVALARFDQATIMLYVNSAFCLKGLYTV